MNSPTGDRNQMVLRARALRRSMTLPERLLWRELRTRPGGFKFRRQHPMGVYVADFYCPAVRLVVEVDGQGHEMGNRAVRDAVRDEWMTEQGMRVVRFAAVGVMAGMEAVVSAIVAACRG